MLQSGIKARKYGFADCIDTEEMFLGHLQQHRDMGLVYPGQHGPSGCLAGGLKGDPACVACETTPWFGR
jgi:hypothetical protein